MKQLLFLLHFITTICSVHADEVRVLYFDEVKANFDSQTVNPKVLSEIIRSELLKASGYKLTSLNTNPSLEKAKLYNLSCKGLKECTRREAQRQLADYSLIAEIDKNDKQCVVSMNLTNVFTNEIVKSQNLRSSCSAEDISDKLVQLIYILFKAESSDLTGERDAFFSSVPSGARITVNNKFLGLTPKNVKIPIGLVKISLEMEKNDRFSPITLNEWIDSSNEVYNYHKVFAEKTAFLKLKVSPNNAKVTLNSKIISLEALEKISLEVHNDHKFVIEAEHYFKQEFIINPSKSEQVIEKEVNLDPMPCDVYISSSPDGADVISSSNEVVGVTPINFSVPPGEHEFLLKKKLFAEKKIQFFCKPQENISQVVNLELSKYSPEDQEKIDHAQLIRTYSYYTAAASLLVGAIAYKSYRDYKKYDLLYSNSTEITAIEEFKSKRNHSKNLMQQMSAVAVFGVIVSGSIYSMGGFPDDVKAQNSVGMEFHPQGLGIAWHTSW